MIGPLAIKAPFFEEEFCYISQLLFTGFSAQLASTLSWIILQLFGSFQHEKYFLTEMITTQKSNISLLSTWYSLCHLDKEEEGHVIWKKASFATYPSFHLLTRSAKHTCCEMFHKKICWYHEIEAKEVKDVWRNVRSICQ